MSLTDRNRKYTKTAFGAKYLFDFKTCFNLFFPLENPHLNNWFSKIKSKFSPLFLIFGPKIALRLYNLWCYPIHRFLIKHRKSSKIIVPIGCHLHGLLDKNPSKWPQLASSLRFDFLEFLRGKIVLLKLCSCPSLWQIILELLLN